MLRVLIVSARNGSWVYRSFDPTPSYFFWRADMPTKKLEHKFDGELVIQVQDGSVTYWIPDANGLYNQYEIDQVARTNPPVYVVCSVGKNPQRYLVNMVESKLSYWPICNCPAHSFTPIAEQKKTPCKHGRAVLAYIQSTSRVVSIEL